MMVKNNSEQISIKITNWIGTPGSIFVHTLFFAGAFSLYFFGISINNILLVLTTVVSLEAIYLAIFIQMTVNKNLESVEVVREEVKEISDDVEEISTDVEEISEDIEEISEDIDKIQEEEKQENITDEKTKMTLEKIEERLQKILGDIESLKK